MKYIYIDNSNVLLFQIFKKILEYWNILNFLKENTYFYYSNNDFTSTLEDKKFIFSEKSDELYHVNDLIKELKVKFNNNKADIDENYINYLYGINSFINKSIENYSFIPIERSIQSLFSLGKNSINNMSDILFNQLKKISDISNEINTEINIEPLNIKYKNDNGKGFVKKNNEKNYYSLENAASGYQSIVPIVLNVKKFSNTEHIFIIEEPENNLFPKTQKKLVEFFVENINNHGHQFILPTHSPYILSALNNCLYAYNLSKIENGRYIDEIEKIIPKENWLNIEDLSVYYLEKGEAKNILNREEGLIDIDDLDSVSRDINKVFDELLTIEMQYEK